MKISKSLFCFAAALSVAWAATAQAQYTDITNPGDPIELVNGTNDGDGSAGAPPAKEGVENAINNIGQKYLNFLDIESGLAVTPSGNPSKLPVTAARFFTANDAPDRDPASYEIFGSNNSLVGPWTLISSGPLNPPADRNPGGNAIPTFNELVTFANSATFDHYKVRFPSLKNAAAANSMQIAEVELLVVPEPTSATLGTLSLLALGALGRRKR